MRHRTSLWILLAGVFTSSLLTLGLAMHAIAAPGQLDPTFGTGGKLIADFTYPVGGSATDAIAQSGGKVLVVGVTRNPDQYNTSDIFLARYTADGRLDSSFGAGGGTTTTDIEGYTNTANALSVQPDGRIVVGGVISRPGNNAWFTLTRYTPDGTLDVTFGNSGTVISQFSEGDNGLTDVVVQADGKIVAVGFTGNRRIVVARYNPDGTFDTGFGSGGTIFTLVNQSESLAWAVALQPDGKIVVVGAAGAAMAVLRYTSTGNLDTSFSGDGIATTTFGDASASGYAYDLLIQPDGKIVSAGGGGDYVRNRGFALARFLPDGEPDRGFGTNGEVVTDLGSSEPETANAVALLPDGKIISGGSTVVNNNYEFALVRYLSDGTMDESFDGDGKAITGFTEYNDGITALVPTANGEVLAVGAAASTLALAQYEANGTLDTSYGTSGSGKVTSKAAASAPNGAMAAAAQPDGKIVVGGYLFTPCDSSPSLPPCTYNDFALARYNEYGQPDRSFGSGGLVVLDVGSGDDKVTALAVQPDGKIVVAGYASTRSGGNYEDFGIVRYNPDGSLDKGFGTGGKVLLDFGYNRDFPEAVALQADGKIVVVGSSSPFDYPAAGLPSAVLIRLHTNGALDTDFQGGVVIEQYLGKQSHAEAVAIDGAGRIVVVGSVQVGGAARRDFAVVRYNQDGTRDGTFGSGGLRTTDFASSYDYARAVQIAPDDAIWVAGEAHQDFALARYTTQGRLDPAFSGDGKASADFGGRIDGVHSVLLGGDGKIVVAGNTATDVPHSSDFALARFTSAGQFDSEFGSAGKVTTNFGGISTAQGAISMPDGRVVVGGEVIKGAGIDFAVARYLPSYDVPQIPTATPSPTPSPTPEPPRCPGERYTDVCPDDYFYEPVLRLNDAGVVSGYNSSPPCTTGEHVPCFRPYASITRGQVAKVIALAAGYSESYNSQTFQDVPLGGPFHQYIEQLASRSIIGGYTCGGSGEPCVGPQNRPYFRPNAPVTRGQFSKMAAQALGYGEPVSGQTFEDVPVDSTFYEYIERIAARRIISGYACGGLAEPCVGLQSRPYFRPANNITRGQAAKIIYLAQVHPVQKTKLVP